MKSSTEEETVRRNLAVRVVGEAARSQHEYLEAEEGAGALQNQQRDFILLHALDNHGGEAEEEKCVPGTLRINIPEEKKKDAIEEPAGITIAHEARARRIASSAVVEGRSDTFCEKEEEEDEEEKEQYWSSSEMFEEAEEYDLEGWADAARRGSAREQLMFGYHLLMEEGHVEDGISWVKKAAERGTVFTCTVFY